MARQAGDTRITGTIDEFCFYKMDGEYYVRKKSRLTGKRFWKDKAFEGSRRSWSRFGGGNRIASKVYRMVDGEKRVYKLFCFLKRRAVWLLNDGMDSEKVEKVLVEYLEDFGFVRGKVKKYLNSLPEDCHKKIYQADFIWRQKHSERNTGELLPVFPFEFFEEAPG